ncbi:MAG: FAD-binding protein [Deltaproteobacteria bacterium]|nr:FAD-binding protein [Deltaproteobacteria bacterium]
MDNNYENKVVETDVLVLGSGAAGCGAAISAREKGAKVLMLDKGKLESSGNLGGGNDHFMAILNSGPETDSTEALVNFFKSPRLGLTEKVIEEAWAKTMPPVLDILQEVGVEFVKNEDGTWLRTVGFGQPGNWWININNGHIIKRLIAKKVRDMDIEVLNHIMVTRLLKGDGRIAGCTGYNVLDGTFYTIKAKKVVMAFGNIAARGWTNSTHNPYNTWFSPYVTGSQFVLPYEAGVKILNIETGQWSTLIPKGFGAPGMNGINSMGGHELNALGERFMGKYDPMWENGLRINQISGTYQELVEGKGPPFYMDMTHLNDNDVRHLQYVLMPGDKATYLDYCEQRGIEFSKSPLEVEICELSFGGLLYTQDNLETNVSGLYNGCLFMGFSGAMCGGYYAGIQAAEAVLETDAFADFDEKEIEAEKEKIFRPMKVENGIGYREVEKSITQVLDYYVGFRRSRKGMEVALEKLALIESYLDKIKATDFHALMRANESVEVLKMARLTILASMERRESGRTYYRRTDYPDPNPEMDNVLVIWQENGQPEFSWSL